MPSSTGPRAFHYLETHALDLTDDVVAGKIGVHAAYVDAKRRPPPAVVVAAEIEPGLVDDTPAVSVSGADSSPAPIEEPSRKSAGELMMILTAAMASMEAALNRDDTDLSQDDLEVLTKHVVVLGRAVNSLKEHRVRRAQKVMAHGATTTTASETWVSLVTQCVMGEDRASFRAGGGFQFQASRQLSDRNIEAISAKFRLLTQWC